MLASLSCWTDIADRGKEKGFKQPRYSFVNCAYRTRIAQRQTRVKRFHKRSGCKNKSRWVSQNNIDKEAQRSRDRLPLTSSTSRDIDVWMHKTRPVELQTADVHVHWVGIGSGVGSATVVSHKPKIRLVAGVGWLSFFNRGSHPLNPAGWVWDSVGVLASARQQPVEAKRSGFP